MNTDKNRFLSMCICVHPWPISVASGVTEIPIPTDKIFEGDFAMDSTRLICVVLAVLFGAVLFFRRRSQKPE
jgi:hypothetical protein